MPEVTLKTNRFYLTNAGKIVLITKFQEFTETDPYPAFFDNEGVRYNAEGISNWVNPDVNIAKELTDAEALKLASDQTLDHLKFFQKNNRRNNIITLVAVGVALFSTAIAVAVVYNKLK